MKYKSIENNTLSALSEMLQKEILERDMEYEAGKTKSYSLDEIIAYFNN